MMYLRRAPWLLAVVVVAAVLPAHAQRLLHAWTGEGPTDRLGGAVAAGVDLDGDGVGDVVAGADEHEGPGGEESGAVYAYSGSTGALLHAWDGGTFAHLGYAVAVVADVDGDGRGDVLAGAPYHDGAAGDSTGAAYLYSGTSGALVRSWEGEVPNRFLGAAVAGGGDVDADGVPDVLLGAQEPVFDGAGAAYVYSGATGGLLWSWQGSADDLGTALAAADVDGDGHADVVVGAPGDDGCSDGTDCGRVDVYSGATGGLLWSWRGDRNGIVFGEAVAAGGDLDGDGAPDVLVGAPLAHFVPGVYAYSGRSGALLNSWDPEPGDGGGDRFGDGLAFAGDVDGDGTGDLLVGASARETELGVGVGKVYLYAGLSDELVTSWVGEEANAAFGAAVAAAGDADGDGLADVLVGAPQQGDLSFPTRGKAYLYSAVGARLLLSHGALARSLEADLRVEGAAAGEEVHYALSLAGVGAGPCLDALGGLCVDLLEPIQRLGTAVADGGGTAVLTVRVPAAAPLVEAATQAVVRRGTGGEASLASNAVTAPIVELGWRELPVDGPGARDSHALAYDARRGVVVLFGGGADGTTWEWDGRTWRLVATEGPASRFGHAMAYDARRGVTVLYGGSTVCCPGQTFDDTWLWNGRSWRRVAEGRPRRRDGHAMAYDRDRAVVVMNGGRGEFGTRFRETWEWDGSTWAIRSTEGPSGRVNHAMAYDGQRHRVVLFGGEDHEGASDETWELDRGTWLRVATDGPSARIRHALSYDPMRGVTVLFGSFRGGSDETWHWDGTGWTLAATDGPAPRYDTALVYDAARRVHLLFGGRSSGETFADTWVYAPRSAGATARR